MASLSCENPKHWVQTEKRAVLEGQGGVDIMLSVAGSSGNFPVHTMEVLPYKPLWTNKNLKTSQDGRKTFLEALLKTQQVLSDFKPASMNLNSD